MAGLIDESRAEAATKFLGFLTDLSANKFAKFLRLRTRLFTRVTKGLLHHFDPTRNRVLTPGELKKESADLAKLP